MTAHLPKKKWHTGAGRVWKEFIAYNRQVYGHVLAGFVLLHVLAWVITELDRHIAWRFVYMAFAICTICVFFDTNTRQAVSEAVMQKKGRLDTSPMGPVVSRGLYGVRLFVTMLFTILGYVYTVCAYPIRRFWKRLHQYDTRQRVWVKLYCIGALLTIAHSMEVALLEVYFFAYVLLSIFFVYSYKIAAWCAGGLFVSLMIFGFFAEPAFIDVVSVSAYYFLVAAFVGRLQSFRRAL